ncbi:MAG: NAD(P)/FAD-dependent oxidoreductase [Alphaproteobacteria bacterium]|nr:NAD(P)/FAD-dependent oxidoreductase [Alphaproteobacteria bacterium]
MPHAQDRKTVKAWLSKLNAALRTGKGEKVSPLFATECYWRDLIALTWNIRTAEGQAEIGAMLSAVVPRVQPQGFTLIGEPSRAKGMIEAWFNFETNVARGKGHLRLKGGKGFTILTTMTELKGHEERVGFTRERGIVHRATPNRTSWKEEREREMRELGHSRQPYCLIVGGGQGGLALGARLKRLGVPTIIAEKNARPGDSWRNRYRTLVLHDPVWYDHLPYIPFPKHWPVFSPKDKIADWLEMYAKVMELDFWGATECQSASYDAAAREWTIRLRRDGGEITLRPKQLVFATGSYGPPREIDIPGKASFAGIQYHSSRHVSAEGFAGKRCIVVGGNSSAHDICADFWECGAEVIMIQRTPTTIVRSETLMDVAFSGLYSEEAVQAGIDADTADLIFASTPFRLMAAAQRPLYAEMARRDSPLIKRLNKAGFRTDYGEDKSGLMMRALRTGSGYYIDVGCSELIASGKVKVRSGVEIRELRPRSVVLTDGREIDADVIVYATGFLPMNEWLAKIISREVADRVGPNWGYGSGTRGDPGPWQGELRNMWKPLAQEALWFHGGNLHLSRHYSRFVALQLKARYEGIPTPVY